MMEQLREWLSSLVAGAMLLAVTQMLIPEGTIKKIGAFSGRLALLLMLAAPLLHAELPETEMDWETYRYEVQTRQDALTQAGEREMAELIEKRTAAYISDKAAELGVAVSARVDTKTGDDGVPLPFRVELTGESSDLLADWVERELGIPKGRQVWHEGKR